MKEQQWQDSGNPTAMVASLCAQHKATRTKAGRRKLRLFMCACLRQVWNLITEEAFRDAVVVCGRFADGLATGAELAAARKRSIERELAINPVVGTDIGRALCYAADQGMTEAAITRSIRHACAAHCLALKAFPDGLPMGSPEWQSGCSTQADLLREIFGNPFRPLPTRKFPPEVRSLAGSCYEGEAGAFGILADALTDLGEPVAAAHCRQSGHVKGCHIVDWVLANG